MNLISIKTKSSFPIPNHQLARIHVDTDAEYLSVWFPTYVAAAQATILGPEDVYVKKGSTISLTCEVNVRSTPPSSVSWHHGGAVVDFDSPRYKPRDSSSQFRSSATLLFLYTHTYSHLYTYMFLFDRGCYRYYHTIRRDFSDVSRVFSIQQTRGKASVDFSLLYGISSIKLKALDLIFNPFQAHQFQNKYRGKSKKQTIFIRQFCSD